MSRINSHEIESVVRLSATERYNYFIKRVADLGELYSLKNVDGWILGSDSDGRQIVPVWSHDEYAKLCANDEWRNSSPARINLVDWMEKWIPGMIKDKRKVGVFPTIVSKATVVEPEQLQDDLRNELSKIE